jgi:hypothetical protein
MATWPRSIEALVLLAGALLARPAEANLRAPVVDPHAPSGALRADAPELQASREILRFTCDAQLCAVTATYLVRSARAMSVGLEFILPTSGQVRASIGGQATPVEIVDAAPLSAGDRQALDWLFVESNRWDVFWYEKKPTLYRARFRGTVPAGESPIRVEYVQPLARKEIRWGYLTRSRFAQRFEYELWPLKEWSRAPDFRIDLQIALVRPPPSWWSRTFGHPRMVGCRWPADAKERSRWEQRGELLVYERTLGDPFPDRMMCVVGDDDLLPEEKR